jgi:P27 family predicted phage terminase small subunit
MARPAKSVNTKVGGMSNEEKANRLSKENAIKGKSDDLITPPKHLTDDQVIIYQNILENLKEANILGNLDIYVLAETAIVIDRMQKIEEDINSDSSLIYNKDLMTSQDKLFKQFARLCNELSLSPQSRAKLALTATQNEANEAKISIRNALIDDDDDE